ncbi:MAG: hypothetical protein QW482_03265 [Thermoproteota archaeon]
METKMEIKRERRLMPLEKPKIMPLNDKESQWSNWGKWSKDSPT